MALKKANTDELSNVVNTIEEENYRTLSPVATDDDGIIRDVPLLAGYIDKDGILHSTFSYREMNGRDEEALAKADVRSNGAKMVNVLCERCVVEIGTLTKKNCGAEWGKIIREMLSGDLDYMAFKIREVSKGNEVTFTHVCPNCNNKLTTIVNTEEFGINYFKGQYKVEFSLPRGYRDGKGVFHKDGVMRIPTGLDRELVTPTISKNPSTAVSLLLTRLVSFNDGTPVTQSGISEMSLRDRKVLEDLLKENNFGLDTTLDITCDSCGRSMQGEIGQSDFL